MNCSVLLLHVQFTYEEHGCVLTAESVLADVHMCSYNIIKSRSASKQLPLSVDVWIYLYTHGPCEQTCLDVQILPLFPPLTGRRTGSFTCQWEVYWVCPNMKCWLKAALQLAGSCACTWLLAGLVHHINTSLPPVKWKKCTCGETPHFVNWMDLITLCCWGCSTLEQYRVQFIPDLHKSHYILFL